MQTFLPYASFETSASVLDYRRLGKQRVETLQILQSLDRFQNQGVEKSGWINHPATQMWFGYEKSLINYGKIICLEWISRGYKDTCYEKISSFIDVFIFSKDEDPWWLGVDKLHMSHKAMLYNKDSAYYAHFASASARCDTYWWPTAQRPAEALHAHGGPAPSLQ